MSDDTSYQPPAPRSAADQAFFARKAAAQRAQYLREHDLHGIEADEFVIVGMCRSVREAWHSRRITSRFTKHDVAMSALSRVSSRYATPASPYTAFRVAFGSGFSAYARTGSTKPALITQHADQLGPDEIRELSDLAAAGFHVLVVPERWVSRMGFRILVSDPTEMKLNPPPEPDPELRPGPSRTPRHVSMRSPYSAVDTVNAPLPVPIRGNS